MKNEYVCLNINHFCHLVKDSDLEFNIGRVKKMVEEYGIPIPDKGISPVNYNDFCVTNKFITINHKLGAVTFLSNPSYYGAEFVHLRSNPVCFLDVDTPLENYRGGYGKIMRKKDNALCEVIEMEVKEVGLKIGLSPYKRRFLELGPVYEGGGAGKEDSLVLTFTGSVLCEDVSSYCSDIENLAYKLDQARKDFDFLYNGEKLLKI